MCCYDSMHLMNVCDYTLCPFYQRRAISKQWKRGVQPKLLELTTRACTRGMMEVEDFLLLGLARNFAGLWRPSWRLPTSRSAESLQPPLHENRNHHLLCLEIGMQPSRKIQDGLPINPGILHPVSGLTLQVQVNWVTYLPGWGDHHRHEFDPLPSRSLWYQAQNPCLSPLDDCLSANKIWSFIILIWVVRRYHLTCDPSAD